MIGRFKFICVLFLVFISSAHLKAEQWIEIKDGAKFSGAPSYITEFSSKYRDNGGPLSPFGSHCGVKSGVEDKHFATVRHYATLTGEHILDYSRTGEFGLSFLTVELDGKMVEFADERRVYFEYYGFREEASFEKITAKMWVNFIDTDSYIIKFALHNSSSNTVDIATIFNFTKSAKKMKLSLDRSTNTASLWFRVQPTIGGGENWLAMAFNFSFKEIEEKDKSLFFALKKEKISLKPGEELELKVVFAFSADSEDAAKKSAFSKLAEIEKKNVDPYSEMLQRRDEFFASLPPVHSDNPDYVELYKMAATALDNAVYAPRKNMKYRACVPTKVHYNWFWLWDSGFQALGYSETDLSLAREVILSVFQSQRKRDGFIAHMTDESEKPLTPHSQPPVFGFSLSRLIPRGGTDEEWFDFKKEIYDCSKSFISWWEKNRDQDKDGLFEFLSQDEGGWDNSPRMKYVPNIMFISYYGSLGEILAYKFKPLDVVDLNAWMYLYYNAMAGWAKELGMESESEVWKKKSQELARKIDEILWDEECGCWLDSYRWKGSKEHKHFMVLTPAIWFPAFAGSTRDENKARRVIEEHLLNPKEFFGDYPIPTVAYNDKYFDNKTPGWTASIWLITTYTALEALYKFGYEKEAEELKKRTLDMMAHKQKGMKGIYETYDPETGLYKNEYSTGGYASFQFGWSSAFTMEILLDRYQEERFIFDDTKEFSGFVRRAIDFNTRDNFILVQAQRELPKIEVKSKDGQGLLKSQRISILAEDPYKSYGKKEVKIYLRGKELNIPLGKEITQAIVQ